MEAGAAVDIFRLPGIYGPGRSAIDQVKAGTARRIDKPGQVFSRIHVEDVAGTVLLALSCAHAGAIYNVADDLPAATGEVVAFACELLGRPVPPAVPWDEVAPTMSAMARSFYAENRRVRNDRIKNELGVALRYPTYKEGLRAIALARHSSARHDLRGPPGVMRRADARVHEDAPLEWRAQLRQEFFDGRDQPRDVGRCAEAMVAAFDQGRDHLGRFEWLAICSEYSHGTSGSLWPCSSRTGQGSASFLSSRR